MGKCLRVWLIEIFSILTFQVATANLAWASVAIHQVQVSLGRVGAPGGELLQAQARPWGWGQAGRGLVFSVCILDSLYTFT